MAKYKSPHKIDEDECTIDGTFKQIKGSNNTSDSVLELTDVWSCLVNPRDSKTVLSDIKENINVSEDVDLHHLKRVQKTTHPTTHDQILQVVICGSQLFSDPSEIVARVFKKSGDNVSCFQLVKVPLHPPSTREIMLEWSERYWPLVWKGNPNNQYLASVRLHTARETENLRKLVKLLENVTPGHVSVATMVTDPKTNKVLTWSLDERCRSVNPLDHSIMRCIQNVASVEKTTRNEGSEEREKNYLCLDLQFYTTHEPCVMCCMALVHSRIGQLFFLKPSLGRGGLLDPELGIHQHKYLNWRFEAWQWVKESEKLADQVPELGEIEA
ncbi:hypothetical protein BABINDRAFT_169042 [Babjeviella inositovora NRRL Y-12698]|uniref:CMP/dCMP-type deaminase domain-containing protein n=1 Tax=Babjeviella inositovora NRRL Y-12698 TaxID=984486 RepID=A0A1E3QJ82_9ASCO|nr:uncharacterized protein BABINDRAFT_169042 [Babjeviella inositovora NRRL Y-12698]ODQ77739.1 hypothetical protein BABINDRAFT_169042 [Babjeviella inositovora NRRL Y-12698]